MPTYFHDIPLEDRIDSDEQTFEQKQKQRSEELISKFLEAIKDAFTFQPLDNRFFSVMFNDWSDRMKKCMDRDDNELIGPGEVHYSNGSLRSVLKFCGVAEHLIKPEYENRKYSIDDNAHNVAVKLLDILKGRGLITYREEDPFGIFITLLSSPELQ